MEKNLEKWDVNLKNNGDGDFFKKNNGIVARMKEEMDQEWI